MISAWKGQGDPDDEQLSVESITNIAEKFIKQFAHKPPIIIMDSAREFDPSISASGMVRDGKIHLFRDGLKDVADVEEALWHELLHYGLRRFMSEGKR